MDLLGGLCGRHSLGQPFELAPGDICDADVQRRSDLPLGLFVHGMASLPG